jgi:hypothetical protein
MDTFCKSLFDLVQKSECSGDPQRNRKRQTDLQCLTFQKNIEGCIYTFEKCPDCQINPALGLSAIPWKRSSICKLSSQSDIECIIQTFFD